MLGVEWARRCESHTRSTLVNSIGKQIIGRVFVFLLAASGLTALGEAQPVTRTLYTFPAADSSATPLYALVNGAKKTIDMTMYELVDTTFSGDLVAACKRGVKVRVILDLTEKPNNTAAYNQLNAVTNCKAAWSNPAFSFTRRSRLPMRRVLSSTAVLWRSCRLT